MLAWEGPYCPYIHACDDRPRQIAWSIPQRRLAHYLLATSLLGLEHLVVDGRDYAVPIGCSYLIPPGALADIGSIAGNQPVWVHFDVGFDARRGEHPHAGSYDSELGERAPLLQPGSRETWGVELPILVPPALTPLFRDSVPRLVQRWREGHRIAVLDATNQLGSLLLAWVAHAWSESTAAPVLSSEARITRAESLALRNLDTPFGVEEFASSAGYSRTRFSAVYQQLRGISPGEFLRRERLRLAETLLARDDLTIARVGELVGYADPTVFGRFFRTQHDISPGEWRRRRAAGV